MDTLILNKDGSPLSILPLSAVRWQEAIKYIWMDRVTVLDWYDDWVVSSPSWETRVPAVIMVKDYIKKNRNPRLGKFNVGLRDRFRCQYCADQLNMKSVTLDHVIPISRGGKTEWENIVASCMPCNSKKGSKLIDPKHKPYRPTYYELANIRRELPFEIKHPSWQQYI